MGLPVPIKQMTAEQLREYRNAATKKHRRKKGVKPRAVRATVPPSKQPSAVRAQNFKQRLRTEYKIDRMTLDSIVLESEGRCDVCAEQLGDGNSLDHCHTSGKVRGLLCRRCNLGLGHFQDNTERLRAAVAYLEKFCAD